jgi:GNAT superfamily N-acetyltransferase
VSTTDFQIVEVTDERTPMADAALGLIGELFDPRDRQPLSELRMEIAEKRLSLLAAYDCHCFAAADDQGSVAGMAMGVYLAGVNAGFVSYLAARPEYRGQQLGHLLRGRLVEALRRNARLAGQNDLAWVLGEVRRGSPWLARLVRERGALPFDVEYFHPGIGPGAAGGRWVLYRQPVTDHRELLPAEEVRRVLFALYRRVYRIRYPLEHPGFAAMLVELAEQGSGGADQGPEG